MTGILEQVRFVANSMNQMGIEWALIGGLAVSVHATPRTTKDIDLVVAIDSAECDLLVDRLATLGFSEKALLMHTSPVQRLGIRVKAPANGSGALPLDLLFSSSGIEREIIASAEPIEIFPDLFVPVARLAHLIAMKTVSENDFDRIQDRADIQELLRYATETDIAETKKALSLIEQRAFNRGKNLQHRFTELLQLFGAS